MRISTQAKLISTALVAVAIAAPIAHGETDGMLLSGGYPQLETGKGFSFKAPSYWNAGPSYWSTVERMVAPITARTMLFAPSQPSMVDARNAYLAADLARSADPTHESQQSSRVGRAGGDRRV